MGGHVRWNKESQRELERPAERICKPSSHYSFCFFFFHFLSSLLLPISIFFPLFGVLLFLLLPPSRTFYLFLYLSFVAKPNQLTHIYIYKTYLDIVDYKFISLFFSLFLFLLTKVGLHRREFIWLWNICWCPSIWFLVILIFTKNTILLHLVGT